MDISQNAVVLLENARGFETYLEGRSGSEILTPADISLTLVEGETQTLTQAFAAPAGKIYIANGNAVPAADDIILLKAKWDLSGTPFQTAKGDTPRPWDVYEVTDDSPATIIYKGNIGPPAIPGWGDLSTNKLSATKSGDEITRVSGPSFSAQMIGNFWVWENGQVDYINSYSGGKLVVDNSTAVGTDFDNSCYIAGPLVASLVHRQLGKFIVQHGRRVYISDQIPPRSWTEVVIQAKYIPSDEEGQLYEDGDDAILVNSMGNYRIKAKLDPPVGWRLNDPLITENGTEAPGDANFGSEEDVLTPNVYHYLHSLTRFQLPEALRPMDMDRTDATKGMVIAQETGSTKIDGEGIDRTQISTRYPVGPMYDTTDYDQILSLITSDALVSPWTDYREWARHDDCTFEVQFNGASGTQTYEILVDTTGVRTLHEVAARIQDAMRVYPDLKDIEFTYGGTPRFPGVSTEKFYMIWPEQGPGDGLVLVQAISGVGYGTDISGEDAGGGIAMYGNSPTYNNLWYNNEVRDVEVPDNRGATHITQWRTLNVGTIGLEAGNKPNIFIWNKDVPICKAFLASVAAGAPYRELTASKGQLANEDFGCLLSMWDDEAVSGLGELIEGRIVKDDDDPDTYKVLDSVFTTTETDQVAVIGSDTLIEASQSGTTVTLTLHKRIIRDYAGAAVSPLPTVDWELTADDEGKPFFWADGTLSIIKRVTSTTEFEDAYSFDRASQPATMDPTKRAINDDVKDEDLLARGILLQNRYWLPLPLNGRGILVPGYLVVSRKEERTYYYSQPQNNGTLLGYYHPGGQLNEHLDDGIIGYERQDNLVIIKTKHGTFKLNTSVGYEFGDADLGERPLQLPDPEVLDTSVGFGANSGFAILENNSLLLFTNEQGVRVLHGSELGSNLSEGKIQVSEINQLEPRAVLAYDSDLGALVYGRQT